MLMLQRPTSSSPRDIPPHSVLQFSSPIDYSLSPTTSFTGLGDREAINLHLSHTSAPLFQTTPAPSAIMESSWVCNMAGPPLVGADARWPYSSQPRVQLVITTKAQFKLLDNHHHLQMNTPIEPPKDRSFNLRCPHSYHPLRLPVISCQKVEAAAFHHFHTHYIHPTMDRGVICHRQTPLVWRTACPLTHIYLLFRVPDQVSNIRITPRWA